MPVADFHQQIFHFMRQRADIGISHHARRAFHGMRDAEDFFDDLLRVARLFL